MMAVIVRNYVGPWLLLDPSFAIVAQILNSILTSDVIQPLGDTPATLRGVDVDRVTLMDIDSALLKLRLDEEVNDDGFVTS